MADEQVPAAEPEDWVAKLAALRQEQAREEYEALLAKAARRPLEVATGGLETSRGGRDQAGPGEVFERPTSVQEWLDDGFQARLRKAAREGRVVFREGR